MSYLFNSIAIAPIDTCVVNFTWVFLNPIHTLVKHKDHIHYILLSPILINYFDLFQLSSQIHISWPTILLPYLFYHNMLRNLKLLNKHFSLLVLFGYDCVCIVCLCCVVMCYSFVRRATCLVERSEWSYSSKRQVTHISSTYFCYALVFQ